MSMGLEVAIGVVVFTLFVVSVLGMALGFEAWLTGERVERCPSCGRRGFTADGARHPAGCPPSLGDWLGQSDRSWAHFHLHRS